MRILPLFQTSPNITNPDSDNPYGNIRDNPGDNTGTPMNEETNGDLQVTLARIAYFAGITSNKLPDNEYNGWQMFDSFVKYLRKYGEIYRYVPSGTPLVLAEVDVCRNVHVHVTFGGSGGIVGLPPYIGAQKLQHMDTVSISNYNYSNPTGHSIAVETAASNEYIGGFGATAITFTVDYNNRLELMFYNNGGVTFWLILAYYAIS